VQTTALVTEALESSVRVYGIVVLGREEIQMPRKRTVRPADPLALDPHTLAGLLQADLRPVATDAHVIAFLSASPAGGSALQLAEEASDILRELRSARLRDAFTFEARFGVTLDELFQHLNDLDPTVVHFSGHASTAGLILHAAPGGGPVRVSGQALARILACAAPRARVVVLAACSTLDHAELLRRQLDIVVAMGGAIQDDAARRFARRFYGAIAAGRSVAAAVAQGTAILAALDLPDEEFPRCVARDGVDPARYVLAEPA
jgi:hypothetical protein